MRRSQTVQDFWNQFCSDETFVEKSEPFQVWSFGNTREMAKELAELVLFGKKTATASLPEANEKRPEEKPVVGGYSVIIDFDGNPLCIIRTTEVSYVPFNEVGPEFAFDEGEGDQSLAYWRGVHWNYFTQEAADLGVEFTEHSVVCCERFRMLSVG